MSDPQKGYHLEFVCTDENKAKQLQSVLVGFDIDAKIVTRKKYFVVYMKDGAGIVDLLNVCEAHVALMNFENLRIVKEMRNSINRQVNCEAANLGKTISAAVKQVEDIKFICSKVGLENIPEGLAETAKKRLEHPEATLKELGEFMDPPLGKSGVNHRLKKLSELAEDLRSHKEEDYYD
jgi:DNA-binding protein WhiA